MRKVIKRCILIAILIIVGIFTLRGVYWFVIHPNTYRYDTAVKNGDVVMGPAGVSNIDKFYTFVKNVENKQPDKIRITAYTKEGYPVINDLDFDGNIIKCTTDNTRNLYGRDKAKIYGEYTRITKDDIGDYMLEGDTGSGVFLFQE